MSGCLLETLGRTSSGGHCSGQYASYWNAFLLESIQSLFDFAFDIAFSPCELFDRYFVE